MVKFKEILIKTDVVERSLSSSLKFYLSSESSKDTKVVLCADFVAPMRAEFQWMTDERKTCAFTHRLCKSKL